MSQKKSRYVTSTVENDNVKGIDKAIANIGMEIAPTYEEGYSINTVWDAKHEDKLLDLMYDIRHNGRKDLVVKLVNDAVDIFHDKVPKGTVLEGHEDFAPKTTSIQHNVITHQGIALTNKNITGEDMTRFLYIFSGTDNTETPTIHSPGIPAENARVSILDTGFFFAAGTALFQGCVFPKTIEDAQVKAFGSATHSDPTTTGYTVFWVSRILDVTKFVNHFQNKTLYSHLHIIDRRSRLSE